MEPPKNENLIRRLERTRLNLLTHTQNIYPYCVGIAYLKLLCGGRDNGFLITSSGNLEAAQKILNEYTGDNIVALSEDEEPWEVYMKYPRSIIIFDSLKSILVNPELLKINIDAIYERGSVVIFIVDYDFPQAEINKLAPTFVNDMTYLSDTFCSNELKVPEIKEFKEYTCGGEVKDDSIYLTGLQIEKLGDILNDNNINIPANNWYGNDELYALDNPITDMEKQSRKRFFNIVYPFNVAKTIEDYRQNGLLEDGIEVVINLFGVHKIYEYSPKFHKLNNVLQMNTTCKGKEDATARHLILTGYPITEEGYFSEYGGDLIYKLLTAVDNPYCTPDQIMRLYLYSTIEEQIKMIDEFNNNLNYKVLIISDMPPAIPKEVHHFHIMDSKLDVAFELIDILYKNQNYPNLTEPQLDIHLYYALRNRPPGDGSKMTPDSFDFLNLKLYIEKLREEMRARWNYEYAYKVRKDGDVLTVSRVNPE
jgi:hypothetical protein